jgi:hypothetical protein
MRKTKSSSTLYSEHCTIPVGIHNNIQNKKTENNIKICQTNVYVTRCYCPVQEMTPMPKYRTRSGTVVFTVFVKYRLEKVLWTKQKAVGEQLTYIIIHKQVQGTATGALISECGQTESQRHTFFRVCEFKNLVLRKGGETM